MNRRAVLASAGAALAGLAGCSGSGDEPTPTSTVTTSPEATPAGTPTTTTSPDVPDERAESTPSAHSLQLLSVDAPPEAEIGRPVSYRLTVQNPTEESQRYEPVVSSRSGAGWSVLDRWEPVALPPGGIRSFSSSTFTSEFLSTHELRVDGIGETFEVEFVERQLPFRESHVDPRNREIKVTDTTFQEVYEYSSDGVRRLNEPGEDRKWIFLTVKVVNRGNESVESPAYDGFSLRDGDRTYRPSPPKHDDAYRPVQLPEGGVASGTVAFNTPRDVVSGDLQAVWHESFGGGDVVVVWTPR